MATFPLQKIKIIKTIHWLTEWIEEMKEKSEENKRNSCNLANVACYSKQKNFNCTTIFGITTFVDNWVSDTWCSETEP